MSISGYASAPSAVYYFQLLALAQGVPYDQLGFQKQRFKPKVLQHFDETTAVAGA